MGGKISHEFLVPAPIGEDKVKDESGVEHVAIEVGHIFQLGTKYTEAMSARFLDEAGKQHPIVMGCYGIGVSRLLATIIEAHHDPKGICWPAGVAPFTVEVLPVQVNDPAAMTVAQSIYDGLTKQGIDVLMDDRDESAGRKFNDADLLGIPYRVTIGKRGLLEGKVEIKDRATGVVESVPLDMAVCYVARMVSSVHGNAGRKM